MTKDRIVEAVMKILGAEGMKGLTTRKICVEAGVAKGTLYHHFENMDSLFLESLKFIQDSMMDKIKSIDFKNIEDFFMTLGIMAIDAVEQQKKNGLRTLSVFDELVNNPVLHKFSKDVHKQWNDITKEKIIKFSKGSVSDETAREIALTFSIVIGGFKTILYYEDDLEFVKKLWKKLAKRLAKYVNEEKWRDE